MTKKWINDKTLNLFQVLVFVVVFGVYALSIKLTFLENIRFKLLLIGAISTVGIMALRFTLVDRLKRKG